MPAPTTNLGLPKPEVNDEAWDDDYYLAMDILDKHPGVAVVDTRADLPQAPYNGQVVLIQDTGRLVRWSAAYVEWRAAVGAPEAAAFNVFNSIPTVAPGADGVVATVVAPVTYRLTGFSSTGTGDGYFTVQIDGTTVMSDRIDNIRRSCRNISPRGVQVEAGTHVTLHVKNEARGTCQYEGTIFGEVETDG